MTQDIASQLPAGEAPFPPYETWDPGPGIVEAIPEKTASRIILAAPFAGFLAQFLFVGQGAGINFPIWVGLVLAAAYAFRRGARIDARDLWLPPAALVFATFMAIRDDSSLLAFDFLATGGLTLASVVAIGGHSVTRRSLVSVARLGGAALAVAWVGLGFLSHGLRPLATMVRLDPQSTAAGVFRGLLVAAPIVLLFAALFAAADAVFQTYLSGVADFQFDFDEVVGRTVFALLAGWLFAGTMAAIWLSQTRYAVSPSDARATARGRLGTTEAIVVLAAVDGLFAFFVLLQAAYLFGGVDTLAVAGLTYSEYARRGFFELIAVAVMAGGLLLVLNSVVAERTWAFRAASVALSVLTGVVLASSALRLGLYQQAYGWTELRFYVLVSIVWLAAGLVAAVVGFLVDRAAMVPKLMLAAGLALALACNVVGPQSFVTAQNSQRAIDPSLVPAGGRTGLDVDYLGWLGADSINVLLSVVDQLPEEERGEVNHMLQWRADQLRQDLQRTGWQSWNLGRQNALDALTAAGY